MSLFDQLVDEALRNQQGLSTLRIVVEKELLHHDILREMSRAGLLATLTLMGGTCLRACYGSSRLSEDLDFTGGAGFSRERLADLAAVLVDRLQRKYGLRVEVGEPTRETGNVATWRVKLQTRPTQPNQPAQRIHIECRSGGRPNSPAQRPSANACDWRVCAVTWWPAARSPRPDPLWWRT